jgi:hypothetical protein
MYFILVLPLSFVKMIKPYFLYFSDFDCILTNLELKKLDKNRYQLPEEERERTQSILKRAIDVEKGVSESAPVTEEHPDGCKCSIRNMYISGEKRFFSNKRLIFHPAQSCVFIQEQLHVSD